MGKEYLDKLINKLASLFEEDMTGQFSMMRYTVFMTITTIVLTWCYLSVRNSSIVDIPTGVIVVFTVCVLGKSSQKFLELYFNRNNMNLNDDRTEPN